MTANIDKPWQMMMRFHNVSINDDMRINMVLVDPKSFMSLQFPSSTGKAVLVGFLSHLGMLPHLEMTQVQEIGKGRKC